MMSRLSVCMATHNGGRYIAQQLESILRQLEPDDELIISDDSSTDDTTDIIRSFRDGRIQLMEGNTFYNPTFNFENALKYADGEIIALSDQDDVWLDGKVTAIREAVNASTDRYFMVILNGLIVAEQDKCRPRTIAEQTGARNGLLRNLFDSSYIGCCMAFKRELLDLALPFPASLSRHDWWLGLLNEIYGTVRFVDTLTIKYRRHDATVTDLPKRIRSFEQITCRFKMAYHVAAKFLSISRHGSKE
jgi:glycosyltransferase involved in cell wall biosynthesis